MLNVGAAISGGLLIYVEALPSSNEWIIDSGGTRLSIDDVLRRDVQGIENV